MWIKNANTKYPPIKPRLLWRNKIEENKLVCGGVLFKVLLGLIRHQVYNTQRRFSNLERITMVNIFSFCPNFCKDKLNKSHCR